MTLEVVFSWELFPAILAFVWLLPFHSRGLRSVWACMQSQDSVGKLQQRPILRQSDLMFVALGLIIRSLIYQNYMGATTLCLSTISTMSEIKRLAPAYLLNYTTIHLSYLLFPTVLGIVLQHT